MKSSLTIESRMIVLAFALICVAIPPVHVDAFRSSAPQNVAPLDLPTKRTGRLPLTQPEKEVNTSRTKFKYDLGIGKNKPVVNKKTDESSATGAFVEPTQFLIEHEAVNTYPSPIDSNSNTKAKPDRKNLPKVNHRRHSEDVLRIRDTHPIRNDDNHDNGNNFSHPVIVPIEKFHSGSSAGVTQLDVNTVWVEMMLHNERSKLLAQ